MARVVLGMSGGVDSSVAAYLLKEAGYEVVGLFMRNWQEQDDSGCCTAEADYDDVRRVASLLDIPYYVVDFSKEYYDRVFKLFVDEYRAGRTPNPDVLCNREIKFDAFAEYARRMEADYIATGHYADLRTENGVNYLLRSDDENKDQTYFLNQLSSKQLDNVLFPLAHITKPEVRRLASQLGLATAKKKDSTGICFIGERNFREFLSNYLPMKHGNIVNVDDNTVVGEHEGVFFYTIGQRRGLGIGGGGTGERWFVVDKDVPTNTLYVKQGDDAVLYKSEVTVFDFNYISGEFADGTYECLARIRHRQPLVKSILTKKGDVTRIAFSQPIKGVACGQYAVCYMDKWCLGGGVISDAI